MHRTPILGTCILEWLAVGVNIPKVVSTSHSQATKAAMTNISLSYTPCTHRIHQPTHLRTRQDKLKQEAQP
jgi:guanyl-specific ribonuclease Sa